MIRRGMSLEITWETEEERRYMKYTDWREPVELMKYWYNFDAHYPPPKNEDYRNCDYFVFEGVCYGPGTIVRLKENKFFEPFRMAFYQLPPYSDDVLKRMTWENRYPNGKPDFLAEFRGGYMNGTMKFYHVRKHKPGRGIYKQEYGNCESSAYVPEDYIECIVEPVYVNRIIGKSSVLGNYKNLRPDVKAKADVQLWPQLFVAGLLLFGCIFTNAKEFFPMLICIIIYFAVWIAFRANNW